MNNINALQNNTHIKAYRARIANGVFQSEKLSGRQESKSELLNESVECIRNLLPIGLHEHNKDLVKDLFSICLSVNSPKPNLWGGGRYDHYVGLVKIANELNKNRSSLPFAKKVFPRSAVILSVIFYTFIKPNEAFLDNGKLNIEGYQQFLNEMLDEEHGNTVFNNIDASYLASVTRNGNQLVYKDSGLFNTKVAIPLENIFNNENYKDRHNSAINLGDIANVHDNGGLPIEAIKQKIKDSDTFADCLNDFSELCCKIANDKYKGLNLKAAGHDFIGVQNTLNSLSTGDRVEVCKFLGENLKADEDFISSFIDIVTNKIVASDDQISKLSALVGVLKAVLGAGYDDTLVLISRNLANRIIDGIVNGHGVGLKINLLVSLYKLKDSVGLSSIKNELQSSMLANDKCLKAFFKLSNFSRGDYARMGVDLSDALLAIKLSRNLKDLWVYNIKHRFDSLISRYQAPNLSLCNEITNSINILNSWSRNRSDFADYCSNILSTIYGHMQQNIIDKLGSNIKTRRFSSDELAIRELISTFDDLQEFRGQLGLPQSISGNLSKYFVDSTIKIIDSAREKVGGTFELSYDNINSGNFREHLHNELKLTKI
jgi:hypothetical protein